MCRSTFRQPGQVNSIINSLADTQWGLVSRTQLIQAGVSSESIKHRLRLGFMSSVGRGVYFVGRGPMSQRAMWTAALLMAGETTLLGGESAAVLHGFLDRERLVDVRCPHSRRRYNKTIHPPAGGSRAVHIRRFRSIDSWGVTEVEGIRVVSPAVALLQMAESATRSGLKNAYLAADMKGLLGEEELAWLTEPKPGHKGVGELRRLILKRNPNVGQVASVLEARFLEICEEARLPIPAINAPLKTYRVDFRWPEARLVVELDGARFHRGVAKGIEDRDRENELVAAGNAVLRFGWGQVVKEPGLVRSRLEQAYRRRLDSGGA